MCRLITGLIQNKDPQSQPFRLRCNSLVERERKLDANLTALALDFDVSL